MSTGLAPPTIPSVETGTPPREWSQSILASSPAKDTPATSSEIPGRESDPNVTAGESRTESQVPKALEKEQTKPSKESEPTTTRDQPSIGETVAQTARQYVPKQVGKTAEYATQTATAAASYLPIPQGVKDTVSTYLSSENKEEPHVSLPSTELKGAQPLEHTGGVGALPGNLSESSVALLPDERQERAQERRSTSPRQRRDTIKPSAAGGDDEPREPQKEEAKIPRDAAFFKGETVASQQPAKSTEARAAKTVKSNVAAGSGPEVGSQKEASETKGQEALSKQEETAAVAAISIPGTASGIEEPNKKKSGTEGSNLASEKPGQGEPDPSQDVQGGGNEEGRTAPAGKVEGGYGEYHPAQLHPPPPGTSVAEYQASQTGAQQQGQDLPASETGKRASVGAEKKHGFMTMVKGEMKILAGKMSGDEHKIEEGKKLVHGDA